jgi:hypothetical protein
MNIVNSLSVIDSCFLVKKNIDMVPIVNIIINSAKIIRVLAIISRSFGWLCIGDGSSEKIRGTTSALVTISDEPSKTG